MTLKAIIFDFDGVIVESMDIKAQAFAYLFREYPKDIIEKVVKLHLDNGGMSRFEKFKIIYKEYLNKKLTSEEEKRLGNEFSNCCYHEMLKCPYVKGVKHFLENNYENYLFFIVSGTPHEEINDLVDERDLRKYFKEVLGSPEKKETLTKQILQTYNLQQNETVFIGDAPNDYVGAKEAGIPFIARIPQSSYNPFNTDTFHIPYQINDFTNFENLLERKLNNIEYEKVT
jgi:HAD superfamily hydrolase (TIGR01549 family)